MTKTHRVTKITALVLTFIMLFSVVCIAGTASAGAVTSTDMVSLYSAGINFSKYGNSEFIVYIKTTHVARFQRVLVHYHFFNGEWRDAYADCIKTFDDGSKIWKATFNSYDCVYAIRYEGDGKVAWDNNNGKDYSYDDVIGPGAAVESERLHNQYTRKCSLPIRPTAGRPAKTSPSATERQTQTAPKHGLPMLTLPHRTIVSSQYICYTKLVNKQTTNQNKKGVLGMTKEVYERVDLEIIQFQTDDVITTSIPYEEDEASRTRE